MTRAWKLPYSVPPNVAGRAGEINGAVFALDGVLSDGWYNSEGQGFFRFNELDRLGLTLLKRSGIEVGVVATRDPGPALMTDPAIACLIAQRGEKLPALKQFLHITGLHSSQVCCTGHDVEDLPLLLHCGLAVATGNASHLVANSVHWSAPSPGGQGAAREVCELILYAQGKLDACISDYLRFDDSIDGNESTP